MYWENASAVVCFFLNKDKNWSQISTDERSQFQFVNHQKTTPLED